MPPTPRHHATRALTLTPINPHADAQPSRARQLPDLAESEILYVWQVPSGRLERVLRGADARPHLAALRSGQLAQAVSQLVPEVTPARELRSSSSKKMIDHVGPRHSSPRRQPHALASPRWVLKLNTFKLPRSSAFSTAASP